MLTDRVMSGALWFGAAGQFLLLVGTYLTFGILTLLLHAELLRGDKAALALASFIGLYWLARLVIDGVYYHHDAWPQGRIFVVAHVLLDCLFAGLTLIS